MLYISHLDLAKTVMRSIVRSGLPVYYSEGFNPKPKLVFGTPLSVGCGGEAEILDIRLMKAVSNAEIFERLSAVMPNGIAITAVYEQKGKLTDVKWAENVIEWRNVNVGPETAAAIEEMFRSPVVMMKKSKSGEREVDITTLMRSLRTEVGEGTLTVTAVTAAEQANYLNPEYIVQAVEGKFGVSGERGWHVITRTKQFLEDGETEFQ